MNKISKNSLLHDGFEVAILFKGLFGILEIVGGVLIAFVNPVRLNAIVRLVTQNELIRDPKDMIANYLVKAASSFSINTKHFGMLYMISHGMIKVVLVTLLWRKKLWAYPLTNIFLFIFIVYQIYRFSNTHSIWLILLTIFDTLMIFLTLSEEQRIRMESGRNHKTETPKGLIQK
jgi:uncharacterized membrane protein